MEAEQPAFCKPSSGVAMETETERWDSDSDASESSCVANEHGTPSTEPYQSPPADCQDCDGEDCATATHLFTAETLAWPTSPPAEAAADSHVQGGGKRLEDVDSQTDEDMCILELPAAEIPEHECFSPFTDSEAYEFPSDQDDVDLF